QRNPRLMLVKLPSLTVGLLTLSSRTLQDRARRLANMKLGRAFAAQPNHHSRRVDPIEGGNLAGNLHRRVTLQTLQRLHEKHSVINIAITSLVPVHTLSLKKELLHGGYPSLAPHRAS